MACPDLTDRRGVPGLTPGHRNLRPAQDGDGECDRQILLQVRVRLVQRQPGAHFLDRRRCGAPPKGHLTSNIAG